MKLRAAKASSKAAQDEVDKLQEAFSRTMAEKAALEDQARSTQEKMAAANNLIRSLAGEKKRWQADALLFAEDKKKLVGNCAIACAFLSYLGPFNHEFRRKLMEQYFYKDCLASGIPVSKDLDLNKFLVDDGTIAEWNSQGLPKDDLSIQNALLITSASRYPLLIDPQGQALTWLKKREAPDLPVFGTTTLSNPRIRDQLEFCMEAGKPLIIEGVLKDGQRTTNSQQPHVRRLTRRISSLLIDLSPLPASILSLCLIFSGPRVRPRAGQERDHSRSHAVHHAG